MVIIFDLAIFWFALWCELAKLITEVKNTEYEYKNSYAWLLNQRLLISFFVFPFLYSFIHMCIHCLGHYSLLPPTPSLSTPLPSRTCSALFSNFVEDINSNKKQRIFASWDKDSYTERFLALLSCTSVLQPI
jgi:hypothetical protein